MSIVKNSPIVKTEEIKFSNSEIHKTVKPKKEKKEKTEIVKEEKSNNALLDKINALNIAEKTHNQVKSIFKKEFSVKGKRSSTRDKFLKLVQLYLLHFSKGKTDLMLEELNNLKALCIERYIAEDKFNNPNDYFASNMEENKKEIIKLFIEAVNTK